MKNSGPGPGSYQIPSQIQDGPKHFMGTKAHYNDKKMRTETGPGQYNPKELSRSISYTMPGRDQPNSARGNPGPG